MTMDRKSRILFRTVRQLIANNDIAEAGSILDGALAQNPLDLNTNLIKGFFLEAKKDASAAREHYLFLSEQFPEDHRADFRLALLALKQKDYKVAEHHMAASEARGLPASRADKLRLHNALGRKDYATWRMVAKRQNAAPEESSPAVLSKLARWAYGQDDIGSAVDFLNQALAIDDRNIAALALARRITIESGEENAAEKAQHYRNKIASVIREELGHGDIENLDMLKSIHPARVPTDINESVLKWAQSVEADAPAGKQEIAARLLATNGKALPPHLSRKPSINNESNRDPKFYDWLDHAPKNSELKRSPLAKYGDDEILVAGEQAPDAIALVFTGLADQAMFPLPIFDRYLAALNLTAVYLRDHNRLLFNNGIASLAPDFAGTVEYLRGLVSELGTRRLITIGASAGGYAAIRYGLALDAECIVGFSAPTNITADFLADDGRGRAVARRLQTLPADVLDALPLIQARERQIPIHLVYGEDMREDRRHALHLEGASGVNLHPLPGVDIHGSLGVLAQEKKLLSFLSSVALRSAH